MALIFVLLVSCLLIAIGALGAIAPARFIGLLQALQSRAGLWSVAGLRLALGASLLLVADTSRAPVLIQVLGVVAMLSGAITPLFGVERFGRLLRWWSNLGSGVIRAWAAVAAAIGATLIWAVWP